MAHAGTMVGGSAQTKQGGSPWAAITLAVALVVATIAGVWLASNAGLVSATAKPAPNAAYDRYLNGVLDRAHAAPYTGGAAAVSIDQSRIIDEKLNGILDRAHAAPSYDIYLNNILDRAHAAPYTGGAAAVSIDRSRLIDEKLNGILDRAHAAPYAGGTLALPPTPTSGTFHGK